MFGRLLLLFITVPFIELVLLLKIGAKIGFTPTLGIIVVTAILGASLTRSQGRNTLQRFHKAQQEGRLPHAEVMDGLMIIIAGAVLLTPGFLTDIAGFLLLVPPVRAAVRGRLAAALKGRIQIVGMSPGASRPNPQGQVQERVIDAKVIDEDPPNS
jgi:UPF0716 protein FxsA